MSSKVLIIGAGFAGCNAAHILSEKRSNWTFDIVESSGTIGGGVKTYFYGGHPYTYGPRHFLTEVEDTYKFICKYLDMEMLGSDHENLTYVEPDQQFYTYPPHIQDIEKMSDKEKINDEIKNKIKNVNELKTFKDHWLYACGNTLYNKFAKTYSEKMWGINDNDDLDGEEFGPGLKPSEWDGQYNMICKVKIRTGAKAAWDIKSVISAFPTHKDGYNRYFDAATSAKNINIHLNTKITDFDIDNYKVKINNEWHKYDIIINTASPEILRKNEYGDLRWRGRDFIKVVLPVENIFPKNVIFMYFANKEPFTRIVEYKKFYKYKSNQSLMVMEVPSNKNKLYPYPAKKDQLLAKKYHDSMPKNVFHTGRAGTYRYIDMDDIILQSMKLDKLL